MDNAYKPTKKIKLFDLDSDDDDENKNASNNKILTHHGKNLNELRNDFELSNESDDDYN